MIGAPFIQRIFSIGALSKHYGLCIYVYICTFTYWLPVRFSRWFWSYFTSLQITSWSCTRLLVCSIWTRTAAWVFLSSKAEKTLNFHAPSCWNSLPECLRGAESVAIFKCKLKIYLWVIYFTVIWLYLIVFIYCFYHYLLRFVCISPSWFYSTLNCADLYERCSANKVWLTFENASFCLVLVLVYSKW